MGTDAELERYFGILSGIVAEYRDGGDQITELCDCGEHDNHDPDPYSTATAGIKEAIRKALVDQAHMNDTEAGILITMEELLRRLDNA
jgi:hypothetical protein